MIRIRSRKSWGARPPKNTPTKVNWKGAVNYIHHSVAMRPKGRTRKETIKSEIAAMQQLQTIAFSRDFSDISYSYVVMPSGRVYAGRGAEILGAHTLGHNEAIGICLAGNYSTIPPTKAQVRAVAKLRQRLKFRFGSRLKMIAHRDVYATSCPGDAAVKAFNL